MRKQYAKPLLIAESFELAEHISGGCGYITNFGNQCPIAEGGVIFFTQAPGCSEDGMNMIVTRYGEDNLATTTVEQLIGMNIQCYNSFADFNQLFTSA